MVYPRINEPDAYSVDDAMFIFPTPEMAGTRVIRGPNIGEPPRNEPMAADLDGVVAIKVGDRITTDHIMPAGARLKYRSNIPKYARYVFEHVDPHFAATCLQNKAKSIGNIIVAGVSYGQGSSREHAALCPMYLGVKAVIAKSFERIHAANLINFGILPLVFKEGDAYGRIEKGDRIIARNWREKLTAGLTLILVNGRTNEEIECVCPLSETQGAMIAAGGLLNYLTSQTEGPTGKGARTDGQD